MLHRLDGGDERAQPNVEKVDVGDGEGDVAVDHHPTVEQPVDQVDECDVAGSARAPPIRPPPRAASSAAPAPPPPDVVAPRCSEPAALLPCSLPGGLAHRAASIEPLTEV